jgi:hypothetical protein
MKSSQYVESIVICAILVKYSYKNHEFIVAFSMCIVHSVLYMCIVYRSRGCCCKYVICMFKQLRYLFIRGGGGGKTLESSCINKIFSFQF